MKKILLLLTLTFSSATFPCVLPDHIESEGFKDIEDIYFDADRAWNALDEADKRNENLTFNIVEDLLYADVMQMTLNEIRAGNTSIDIELWNVQGIDVPYKYIYDYYLKSLGYAETNLIMNNVYSRVEDTYNAYGFSVTPRLVGSASNDAGLPTVLDVRMGCIGKGEVKNTTDGTYQKVFACSFDLDSPLKHLFLNQ